MILPNGSGAEAKHGNESRIAVATESSGMLKHRYFHDQIKLISVCSGEFSEISSIGKQRAHIVRSIINESRIPKSTDGN